LKVIINKPRVGADRLQRARDDPFRLVPPRRREGVFLCIPFRMIVVPVTHDLIHLATVHTARLPLSLLDEVAEERGAWRKRHMVDVAVQGLVHSEHELSHTHFLSLHGTSARFPAPQPEATHWYWRRSGRAFEFSWPNAQTQRPGARDATIAIATPPAGSLQRMVRPFMPRHSGLMNSMPFLAAASTIRFIISSVIRGGDAERSVTGWNDSSKNRCMPVGPAGEMMTIALAGIVPSFFMECTVPRG